MTNKIGRLLICFSMIVPGVALAQDANSILTSLTSILNLVIPIIMALALIYFLWGLVQYVSAGESDEKRTAARNTIIYGVIVLFAMTAVWGLVRVITNTFNITDVQAPGLPQVPGPYSRP